MAIFIPRPRPTQAQELYLPHFHSGGATEQISRFCEGLLRRLLHTLDRAYFRKVTWLPAKAFHFPEGKTEWTEQRGSSLGAASDRSKRPYERG